MAQKLRKVQTGNEIDVELKRIVENIPLKMTITLMPSIETAQAIDIERHRHFRTRGDCCEYYARKGFEAHDAGRTLRRPLDANRTKITMSSVLLSVETVQRFDRDKGEDSRINIAEYYIRLGMEYEGVL